MEESVQALEARIHREHWWFEGRRRILSRILGRLFPERPHRAVALEVGCGTGANARVLASFRRAVGLDISQKALREPANRHRTKIRADVMTLPIKDKSVDLVLAADILEHLDDHRAAVREIKRTLKPSGWLVVFVPALEILWGAQDDLSHHRRRYRKKELEQLLTDQGFTIVRLTYFNMTFFLPILVIRKLLKWTRRPLRSENEYTRPWINRLLTPVFAAEGVVLERTDLPIGVSLMALARAPETEAP